LDGESYTVVGVMAPGVNKEPLWPVLAIRADGLELRHPGSTGL